MPKTGVLLTGFGGPDCLDSVSPFMCNLMGREPSPELVERIKLRYLAVGGASPLLEIATAIARKLEEVLTGAGHETPVAVGMCYWNPTIGEALAALKAQGCERVVTVSLSPFESRVAHGAYRKAIDEALVTVGDLEVVEAPLVGTLDEYASFYAGSTAAAIMDLEPNEGALIVFTAHSLPESDLVENDPYVEGLQDTASQVAEILGLGPAEPETGARLFSELRAYGSLAAPRGWILAYQSKGARGGSWLGPDVDEVIAASAAAGVPALVVVPIGFMTDHLETMYDLDIDAAGAALDADLEFSRGAVPNDDEDVVKAIAGLIANLL